MRGMSEAVRQITIWDFGVETAAAYARADEELFAEVEAWAPLGPLDDTGPRDDLFPDAPRYRFVLDDATVERLFESPLHRELIATEAFQRLRDISFLGVIDRLFHPNGRPSFIRHNRFHHSLGVALLALRYCRMAGVTARTHDLLVAAALLHDIGHGPLSHTLEPVFAKRFGIDHHKATAAIVKGEVALGREVRAVLDRHGVDPDEIVDLIMRRSTLDHGHIFGGPINVDTIDGICRANTYLHRAPVDAHPLVSVLALAKVDSAGVRRLDGFWALKERVYANFIYGDVCRSSDHLVAAYVDGIADRLGPDDFYLGEGAFMARAQALPRLMSILVGHIHRDYLASHGDKRPLAWAKERRFVIDTEVVLHGPQAYARRYGEVKSRRKRPIYGASALEAVAAGCGADAQPDLFAA